MVKGISHFQLGLLGPIFFNGLHLEVNAHESQVSPSWHWDTGSSCSLHWLFLALTELVGEVADDDRSRGHSGLGQGKPARPPGE